MRSAKVVFMESIFVGFVIGILCYLTLNQLGGKKVVMIRSADRVGIIEGAWIVQALRTENKQ